MFFSSRFVSCLILLLAISLPAVSQSVQQPTRQPGTATVSGTVKLGDAPAIGIPMALVPAQNGRQPQGQQDTINQTATDETGQYRFTGVVAGTYRVVPMTETLVITSNPATPNASGGPGNPGGFGAPGGMGGPGGNAGGKAITVSDGQAVSQIDFTLARGGVITGRVSDNNDRPVIAERITLATVDANGQARPFAGANRFGLETDDRGVYRAYGLPPGKYLVSAGDNGGNRMGPAIARRASYTRTFHPSATEEAEAQAVEISDGTVAENIDIHLGGSLKSFAVAGKVVDSQSGQPLPGVTVSITREVRNGGRGMPQPGGGSSGTSNEKGEFKIPGLMPGRYTASATPINFSSGTPISGDFYSEPTSFEISSDDATGVEVHATRGASIAGIVAIEGPADPTVGAKLSQLLVFANSRSAQQQGGQQRQATQVSSSGRNSASSVGPDGLFRVSGLAPGQARLNISGGGFGGSGGGTFRLVRIERNGSPINGDIELTSGEQVAGIRIVVGFASAVIQGRVIVTGGTLPPNARLNVTARSLSATSTNGGGGFAGGGNNARIEADGQFRIENLLPGSYEVRLTGTLGAGPGGRGQGVGQGRGGQGTGAGQQQSRLPEVRQTVTVANGTPTNVTLTLNLTQ